VTRFSPSVRCAAVAHAIESLESRIAPASVLLTPGDGPFTLELDPVDSHLHITSQAGATEIYDAGGPVLADNLFVTGGGSSDTFSIIQSAAGMVTITGALDVNISGPIGVAGALSTGADFALTTGQTITQTANVALTGSTVHYSAASGVFFEGGSLSTVSGSIFIAGNPQAVPLTGNVIGINVGAATISSTSGDITLAGQGGTAGSSGNYGVYIQSGGSVGNGTSGAVSVTGTGGDATTGENHGVFLSNGTITAGAGGTVEVTGFGGKQATTAFNVGVYVLTGSFITSTDGDVAVNGTGGGGAGTGGSNYGVLAENGLISAGGNGKLEVTGQGGLGDSLNNIGVWVKGSSGEIAGNGGPVAVNGIGGNCSSGTSYGVYVTGGAEIRAIGTGTLDVSGEGGAIAINNYGVFVTDTNSKIRAALGNMAVTGRGGNGGGSNSGIRLDAGGELLGEGGVMTVAGTGGTGATNFNFGLDFSGSSLVTSTGGNVELIGQGGGETVEGDSGLAGFGLGIETAATISITGPGNLTLTGAGAKIPGDGNIGVRLKGSLSTAEGNVTVTGTGGGTSVSNASDGVFSDGVTINAGATGNISVTGIGGAGQNTTTGVSFVSGPVLQSVDGNITVLGVAGGGGGEQVRAIDFGDVTLRTTGAGNIELIGDAFDIDTSSTIINAGTHTVSLHPATLGAPIDVGGPDTPGVLGLTDAELDRVTAGRLAIGDNSSGALNVTAPITRSTALDLALFSGTGIVNLNASLDTAGGKLLFQNATYFLRASNLIADTTPLEVHVATFQLGLFNETVQSLTLDHGNILGTGTLTSATAFALLSGRIDAPLGGAAGLVKSSPDTVILGNPTNTFTGTVTINAGILQVAADGAFGAAANELAINNATLRTTATFTSQRTIDLNGPATFDIILGTTLTVNGPPLGVNGPGPLTQTGGGTLIIIGNNFPFTVDPTSITFQKGSVTTVDGSIIQLGGTGTVVVKTGPPESNDIRSIELSDTTLKTTLSVKSPKDTVTEIAKIFSADPADSVGKIILGKGVLFGDGLAGVAADSAADLAITGRLGALIAESIGANTLLTIGKGLSYNVNPADPKDPTPDTYNNKTELKINQVMGAGVTFDLTPLRDGMGQYVRDVFGDFVGGGGLGKVTVGGWGANGAGFPGLIKTTQSITSFTLKNGDCAGTFEVDKDGVGQTTPGNVGTIKVLNGSWTSAGNVIDGFVGLFDVGGFATGADLRADYIQKKFLIRGTFTDINGVAYGGTTTLKKDLTSGAFSISVGDFTGTITAAGAIGTFTANGTFSGALTAKSILAVTADEFVKVGLTGPLIKSTGGAIGPVTTKFGGIANTTISSSTNIGKITSKGPVMGSQILAGADRDNNGNYVVGDPTPSGTIGTLAIAGTLEGSTIAARSLDALTFRYRQIATRSIVAPAGVSTTLIALQSFKTPTVGLKVGTAPVILNATFSDPGSYYFTFLAGDNPLGTIHFLKL
jgi:hypothetical protein